VAAEALPWHGQPCSAEVTLPPLGVVWLVPEKRPVPTRGSGSPATAGV